MRADSANDSMLMQSVMHKHASYSQCPSPHHHHTHTHTHTHTPEVPTARSPLLLLLLGPSVPVYTAISCLLLLRLLVHCTSVLLPCCVLPVRWRLLLVVLRLGLAVVLLYLRAICCLLLPIVLLGLIRVLVRVLLLLVLLLLAVAAARESVVIVCVLPPVPLMTAALSAMPLPLTVPVV
jgi:hypothetical protein